MQLKKKKKVFNQTQSNKTIKENLILKEKWKNRLIEN